MTVSELVVPKLGWAKREEKNDGTTEEIIGIHFLRPTDELIRRIKKEKFNQIYKKIRNPDKKENIENKVDRIYDKGRYNPEIPEIAGLTLHQESNEEIAAHKRYSSKDKNAGIGFIMNSCRGAMRYDSFISQLPKTGLEDILSEINGFTYRKEFEDEDEEEATIDKQKSKRKISKKELQLLERKLNRIYREIDKQDKKYTFNFAIRLQIEANNWDSANKIVEEYTSFIKDKAIVESELKPVRCDDKDKIRAVYLLHVKDPKTYDISDSVVENANGLMDMQINEIVKKKHNEKPGKEEEKIKEKLSNKYQVKYWWKFWNLPTILRARARGKLMDNVKMGVLGWIYNGMAEKIIEKTASEDFYYNEVGGSPYSSMSFFGSDVKGVVKILPWHSSLKDEMPNWEWLEVGKEYKSELESDLEEEGTEKWIDYLNKQGYLGTQVIGIRYKEIEDRNKVLKDYSLLPSLFKTESKTKSR